MNNVEGWKLVLKHFTAALIALSLLSAGAHSLEEGQETDGWELPVDLQFNLVTGSAAEDQGPVQRAARAAKIGYERVAAPEKFRWRQRVSESVASARIVSTGGGRFNVSMSEDEVEVEFSNASTSWQSAPEVTSRQNFRGIRDFTWVEANGFSSGYSASITLPSTYRRVVRCEGSRDNPECFEVDRYVEGAAKPYYKLKNGQTKVFMKSFSGAGGVNSTTANPWWTVGFRPDLNIRAMYSDLKRKSPSTTDVTVEASNIGFGTWSPNVTLYNYTNSSLSWSQTSVGSADGAIESLVPADLDNDSDPDLVWGDDDNDDVEWAENQGGSWTVNKIGNNDTESATVGDLDGDGSLDVIVGGNNAYISWFDNVNGDGSSWTRYKIGRASDKVRSIAVTDLDSDGDLDIVSVDLSDDLIWWENDGSNSDWPYNRTVNNIGYFSVATADVSGDGNPDIITGDGEGKVSVYISDGAPDPSLSRTVVKDVAQDVYSVTVDDFDKDGDLDIASVDARGDVHLHYNDDGDGTSWTTDRVNTTLDSSRKALRAVQTGDVDFDGDTDLVVGFNAGQNLDPEFIENDGTSSWSGTALGDTGDAGHYGIALADFDGDGDIDVASGEDDSPAELRIWDTQGVSTNYLGSATVSFTSSSGGSKNATVEWTPRKKNYDLMAKVDEERKFTQLETNDETAGQVNNMMLQEALAGKAGCSPPAAGDWYVDFYCNVSRSVAFNGDVLVDSFGTLNISENGTLDLDLKEQSLILRQNGTTESDKTSTQQGWNGGNFDGTSADRSANSGTLGIGYPNGTGQWDYQGSSGYTDITGSANLSFSPGGGATVLTDIDQDGLPDVFMTDNDPFEDFVRLRENDGDNTFTSHDSELSNLHGRGAASADYQEDGDLDLVYNQESGNGPVIANNTGSFSFTESTRSAPINEEAVSWVDIDGDGDLDIYAPGDEGNYMWFENDDGSRSFTRRGALPGASLPSYSDGGEGGSVADFTNDGYPDFIMFTGTSSHAYTSDGDYTYTLVNNVDGELGLPEDVGSHENMEYAWNDYDTDGDLDVYISGADTSGLYRNDGTGSFTDVTSSAGVGSVSNPDAVDWGDYDNNGDEDLILVQCGSVSADALSDCSGPNVTFFSNDGDGTFTEATAELGLNSSGTLGRPVGFFDSDNDGDLDLISNDPLELWKNKENDGNYLNVIVRGNTSKTGGAARTPIGAKVYLYDADGGMIGHKQLYGSFNLLQPPLRKHFGLNPSDPVNVSVWYPSSSTWTNITRLRPEEQTANVGGNTLENTVKVVENVSSSSTDLGASGSQDEDDLVGYWRLDRETSVVKDYSGNDLDGENNGANSGVKGVFSTDAFSFDGSGSYVDTGPNRDIEGEITFAAWVKPDSIESDRDDSTESYILSGGYAGGSKNSAAFGLKFPVSTNDVTGDSSSEVSCQSFNGTTHAAYVDGDTFSNDVWYHVTCIYTGSEWKIYVNGQDSTDVVQNGGKGAIPTDSPTYIGAHFEQGSTVDYFNGTVDEVRIYDRALTTREVRDLYFSGSSGSYRGNYSRKLSFGTEKRWLDLSVDLNLPSSTSVNATFKPLNGAGNVIESQTKKLKSATNDYVLDVKDSSQALLEFNGTSTDPTKTWEISDFEIFYGEDGTTSTGASMIIDSNASIE